MRAQAIGLGPWDLGPLGLGLGRDPMYERAFIRKRATGRARPAMHVGARRLSLARAVSLSRARTWRRRRVAAATPSWLARRRTALAAGRH
eukprot:125259-Prymnesium_polylepis.1